MKRPGHLAATFVLAALLFGPSLPVAAATTGGSEPQLLTFLNRWFVGLDFHPAFEKSACSGGGTDRPHQPTGDSTLFTEAEAFGPAADKGGDTDAHPLVDPDG